MDQNKIIYPPCKKCGKSHKMGVEMMATGHIEPLDICYDCLWFAECKTVTHQISFNDLPEICDVNILQRELSETMKKIFVGDQN